MLMKQSRNISPNPVEQVEVAVVGEFVANMLFIWC